MTKELAYSDSAPACGYWSFGADFTGQAGCAIEHSQEENSTGVEWSLRRFIDQRQREASVLFLHEYLIAAKQQPVGLSRRWARRWIHPLKRSRHLLRSHTD